MTRAVVVMGPSGCGKTTLGRDVAKALGWRFIEGDDLHPPANRAKMSAGVPLDDADRAPWLAAIRETISGTTGPGAVVACSALKRRYRDALRGGANDVTFVLPMLTREALVRRLTQRTGHFMPVSLLDSQLATLEPPAPDEDAITVDGAADLPTQVAAVLARLRR